MRYEIRPHVSHSSPRAHGSFFVVDTQSDTKRLRIVANKLTEFEARMVCAAANAEVRP